MLACPSRQSFIDHSHMNYDHLEQFMKGLEGFRKTLWQYYIDKGLDKLP
jgi:hypothetical protein